MKKKLVIFAKNPVEGQVKTRISNMIGTGKALQVYNYLFEQTLDAVSILPENIEVTIFFSDNFEDELYNSKRPFNQQIQSGKDLGERMSNAFLEEFKSFIGKVCLIGTDIKGLDNIIIEEAFDYLEENDIVLGPASDGGYYLIGMKQYYPEIFRDIEMGKSSVLKETIERIKLSELKFTLLPILSDVDEFEDIPEDIIRRLNLNQ